MKNKTTLPPAVRSLAKTILILFLATLFSLFFLRFVNNETITAIFYLFAVFSISRVTPGYLWGVLSSFLCVIGMNFFFTKAMSGTASSPWKHAIFFAGIFIVFLITSLMTSHSKEQLKQYREQDAKSARERRMLGEITSKLLTANSLALIIDISLEYISQFTESSVIFYSSSPQSGDKGIIKNTLPSHERIINSRHEQFIAHWVFEHQVPAGVGTDFCGNSSCIYLPLMSHHSIWGVIGIFCTNQKLPGKNKLGHLYLLLSQVAMSLERQHLSDDRQQIQIETEKEKMRANLLRAVSHDLRTPLTGMIGASEILIQNKELLSEEEKDRLIRYVHEDSNWLLHMVENLLSVTRIREGSSSVDKTEEPLEEVVSEAVTRIKKRYPEARLKVKVPDEFLLVPMDATLIEQVILNLIENALIHSGSDLPVELEVTREEGQAVFQVIDHGTGILPERLDSIFDGSTPSNNQSSDAKKGIGIGLSICKTIVNAHGGTITARNKEDGGAVFSFTLPMEGENKNES